MLDWDRLTLFLYITVRMAGFILFNPFFGRTNVPNTFKAGFSLVLAVAVKLILDAYFRTKSGLLLRAIRIRGSSLQCPGPCWSSR